MTKVEIEKHKQIIDGMSQYGMSHLLRFAPVGHPYFCTDNPELVKHFTEKFKEKGGMTPEISKQLGWDDTLKK